MTININDITTNENSKINNEYELISVILPVYNVEQYLDNCVRSLLSQDYCAIEIIMIDDGSTDSCPQKCDEYAELYENIIAYHKENGGLSDARNYGIERANGKYITCVDSDDYVDSDYISYMYELIHKYDAKLSLCQSTVHYDGGRIKIRGSKGDECLDARKCLEKMLYHDVIDTSAWGKLYHRSLFENVRYPVGKLYEDIGTTYKLMIKSSKIAVGYESKYHYIFHRNSIVTGMFNRSKFDLIEMTDKMGEEVLEVYPDLKEAVIRRRVYSRISTLNQLLTVEGYDNDRKSLILFILENKHYIWKNKKAPKRDKVAIAILCIHYSIYKLCWLTYQRYLMGKDK